MKNIKIRKMIEEKNIQCVLCQANFEIWLNNSNFSSEKEEKLHYRFLSYCPVCKRKDESN